MQTCVFLHLYVSCALLGGGEEIFFFCLFYPIPVWFCLILLLLLFLGCLFVFLRRDRKGVDQYGKAGTGTNCERGKCNPNIWYFKIYFQQKKKGDFYFSK